MSPSTPPVIFDLDGTLIDSAPDIHAAVNAVLREAGAEPLTLAEVRGFVGGGVETLWRGIMGVRPLNPAERGRHIAAFMTRYHGATARTRLYPGVIEALGQLCDRGYLLGICTNKPYGPTLAVLDHFGIRHLFGAVIAGDTLPQRKPSPEPLWAALNALGASAPGDALFVGDSEYDAETALAAAVPFFLFTRGYRKVEPAALPHTARFDDWLQLPLLVEGWTR